MKKHIQTSPPPTLNLNQYDIFMLILTLCVTAQYAGSASTAAKTGLTSRPEQKLCELCLRHNIDIKFDEFAGAVSWFIT